MIDKSELQTLLDLDLQDAENSALRVNDRIPLSRIDSLRRSVFKKFKDESTDAADAAAIQNFFEMNDHCLSHKIESGEDDMDMILNDVAYQFWKNFDPMSNLQVDISWPTLFMAGGLGPGANRDVKSYNFYTKLFDSTLSSTSDFLHRIYTDMADRYSPTLRDANLLRSSRWGNGIVSGNKLTTVAKNIDISRCICTEPTLNMFFQKGLAASLELVLKTS